MKISELIAEFGKAVSDAQQKIEMNYIDRFFDYFKPVETVESAEPIDADMTGNAENNTSPKKKTKILEPATVKVELPCSDDISRFAPVEVPLVTLVHHKQVCLNQVTVKVKPRFTRNAEGGITADINAPVFNSASSHEKTEAASKDDIGEIELVFNVADSSEGISRVVQDISKII